VRGRGNTFIPRKLRYREARALLGGTYDGASEFKFTPRDLVERGAAYCRTWILE